MRFKNGEPIFERDQTKELAKMGIEFSTVQAVAYDVARAVDETPKSIYDCPPVTVANLPSIGFPANLDALGLFRKSLKNQGCELKFEAPSSNFPIGRWMVRRVDGNKLMRPDGYV